MEEDTKYKNTHKYIYINARPLARCITAAIIARTTSKWTVNCRMHPRHWFFLWIYVVAIKPSFPSPLPNLIKEPGHFVIRNSSIVGAWSLTIRNPEGAPKKCHHTLINSSATPSGMVFQLQKSSRKCDVFPSLSGPLPLSHPCAVRYTSDVRGITNRHASFWRMHLPSSQCVAQCFVLLLDAYTFLIRKTK